MTWCHVGTANRVALILLADGKANSTSQAKKTGTGAINTMASPIMVNTLSSAELRVALLVTPHNRYAGVLAILTLDLSMALHLAVQNSTSKRQESSNCLSHLQIRSRCTCISSLGRMLMLTIMVLRLTSLWLQQLEFTSLSSVTRC